MSQQQIWPLTFVDFRPRGRVPLNLFISAHVPCGALMALTIGDVLNWY